MLILPQLSAINADPAQNWHASSTPLGKIVIQISRFKSSISRSYDRGKLASFPYWKSHQKFRIFASARFRLNRQIFGSPLRGMVEHAPILRLTLKISKESTKFWSNFPTQNAKNALLSGFVGLKKSFKEV